MATDVTKDVLTAMTVSEASLTFDVQRLIASAANSTFSSATKLAPGHRTLIPRRGDASTINRHHELSTSNALLP